jgi:hypothetical protein
VAGVLKPSKYFINAFGLNGPFAQFLTLLKTSRLRSIPFPNWFPWFFAAHESAQDLHYVSKHIGIETPIFSDNVSHTQRKDLVTPNPARSGQAAFDQGVSINANGKFLSEYRRDCQAYEITMPIRMSQHKHRSPFPRRQI